MKVLHMLGVAAMGLVLLVVSPPQPAATAPLAQESHPRVITVGGDDEVKAAPDKASVHLGVQSQGATADETMRKNNELMGAVIGAIRAAGIPEQDIQTVGLNLWPIHGHTPPYRVTGYQAHNNVSVTINDLGRLVWVIDGGIGAGANLAGGVNFGFKDDAGLRQRALVGAAKVARAKAEAIAAAMGTSVVGLHSMSEGGFRGPIPYPGAERGTPGAMPAPGAPEDAKPSVPVQPGQMTITANVTAAFLIG